MNTYCNKKIEYTQSMDAYFSKKIEYTLIKYGSILVLGVCPYIQRVILVFYSYLVAIHIIPIFILSEVCAHTTLLCLCTHTLINIYTYTLMEEYVLIILL
jgi:hypothetical protein